MEALLDKSTVLDRFVYITSFPKQVVPCHYCLMMCIALLAKIRPTTKRLRLSTQLLPGHSLLRSAQSPRHYLMQIWPVGVDDPRCARSLTFHRSSSIHLPKWSAYSAAPFATPAPNYHRHSYAQPKVESCAIGSELSLYTFSCFLSFFFLS